MTLLTKIRLSLAGAVCAARAAPAINLPYSPAERKERRGDKRPRRSLHRLVSLRAIRRCAL